MERHGQCQALAFSVVLRLDFVFFSRMVQWGFTGSAGRQGDIFFMSNHSSHLEGARLVNVALFLACALWTLEPPLLEVSDLLEKAAHNSHLEGKMRERFKEMLQ